MSLHPVRALLRTRLVRPRVEDHAAPHRHGLPDATVAIRLKMHTSQTRPRFPLYHTSMNYLEFIVLRYFPTALVTLARLASRKVRRAVGVGPAPHVTPAGFFDFVRAEAAEGFPHSLH